MARKLRISLSAILGMLLLGGCNLSDEDKQRIEDAEDNIEKIALAPLIVYPSEADVIRQTEVVRVDVDESVTYEKVSLLVDGIEIATDVEYPYEFEWNPYFWSTQGPVSLLARAVTTDGTLLRSDTRTVTVDETSFKNIIQLSEPSSSTYPHGTTFLELDWADIPGAKEYEYQINNAEPIKVSNSHASVSLTVDGDYLIEVRALEGGGLAGTWNRVAIFKRLPPAVPNTNINAGEGSSEVHIGVTLDNSVEYKSVSLYVNGESIQTLTEAPYNFTWNPYYWSQSSDITWQVVATLTDDTTLVSDTATLNTDSADFNTTLEILPTLDGDVYYNINELDIAWNPTPDAISYEYSVNGILYSTTELKAKLSLVDLGDYSVTVRASDTSGRKGTWSKAINFSVQAPDAPGIVSPIFDAKLTDVASVEVSWETSVHASSYDYRVNGAEFQTTSNTTAIIKTDNPGLYSIEVRAKDDFGRSSGWGANHSFWLTSPQAPQLSGQALDLADHFEIALDWQTTSYQTEVVISKEETFTNQWNSPTITAAGETTNKLQVPAGKYFARVRAINSVGHQSGWSNTVTIEPGMFSLKLNIASYGFYTSDRPLDFLIEGSDIVLLSANANEGDGSGDDFHLSKWSVEGKEQWANSYKAFASSGRNLSKTSSGYILSASGLDYRDGVLLAVDTNGIYQWQHIIEGYNDATSATSRTERVESPIEVSDNKFIFIKNTYNYKLTDGNNYTTSKEFKIVHYDRDSGIETVETLSQPTDGSEYGAISKLAISGDEIFAAGQYVAADGSNDNDSSSDSFTPSESTSGAYVLSIDPNNGHIDYVQTGGGIVGSSVNGLSISNYGLLIGYSNYNAGAATLIEPFLSSQAVIDSSISNSRAAINPSNGDILLVGKDRNSAVSGEPLVVIRYQNGTEIARTNLYNNSANFYLYGVAYNEKYGLVILGTDGVSYGDFDTQTIIFNVTDDFEYLNQ